MKTASLFRTRILPAFAAVLVVALLGVGGWHGYHALVSLPFERVVLAGDTSRLTRADIEAFEASVRDARSVAAVQEAAKRIPWVRDAAVRRLYPEAIEVTLVNHQVLARWGDGALVSPRGEVFTADYKEKAPRFRGPEGSALLVASEYALMSGVVAPLANPITELRLSARGAWQVVLESGLVLELGRGDVHPRLERFVAAWPQLAAKGVETQHADLRHANGFALRTAQVRK
jgi:cell division protein FtsQ